MRSFLLGLLLVACDSNTTKPSGDNQTGIDATDQQCAQLRKDLAKNIDKAIADMKKQGLDASKIPSRAEAKKQFEGKLKANGCSGF